MMQEETVIRAFLTIFFSGQIKDSALFRASQLERAVEGVRLTVGKLRYGPWALQ